MSAILIVGIIIFCGFFFGEFASKIRLPRITGYIAAGILLNPGFVSFIPKDIAARTNLITNISLSFITFSIGGTLLFSKIKKLGKGIGFITLFEAEFSFLFVALGFIVLAKFIPGLTSATFATFVAFGILIGAIASPTDPTGTLAVTHQYKSKGEVTTTILGVSAFDDATGIINYSVAVVFALSLMLHEKLSIIDSFGYPILIILGSLLLGVFFGLLLNFISFIVKRETEGVLIVVIFALLALCYGLANLFKVDELLSTMTMGAVVVNFNSKREKIFKMLSRYTEELVFVIFFTLSGMQLNFSVFSKVAVFVIVFAILRFAGKYSGSVFGAFLAKTDSKVRNLTSLGLVPYGGIVVGLALLIKQNPAFDSFSDIILSIIIGSTVIHELIGPVLAEVAFKRAGEIHKH